MKYIVDFFLKAMLYLIQKLRKQSNFKGNIK